MPLPCKKCEKYLIKKENNVGQNSDIHKERNNIKEGINKGEKRSFIFLLVGLTGIVCSKYNSNNVIMGYG